MKLLNKKKEKKHSWIYGFFIILIFCIFIILSVLPDILGLYNTMIGKEGLKCIIKSIIFKDLSLLILLIPITVHCFNKYRSLNIVKTHITRIIILILWAVVTFILFLLIEDCISRTRFYENEHINHYQSPCNIKLMQLCISDYFSDEYDEYIVNQSDYSCSSHISSTGVRRSSSSHCEFVVCFSDNSEQILSKPVVKAQIGLNDYKYYSENLPNGYEIKITVYKKSRFIRSIEPSVNFTRQESYSKIYEITFDNGSVSYKKNLTGYSVNNLQWCGFKKGESEEITNCIFGIGADHSSVFDRWYGNVDEICLYAVIDGKYRRVSNIIHVKSAVNQ